MKPLRPYITLSSVAGSATAYELSVVIFVPDGHSLDSVVVTTAPDNNHKQQDLVIFKFLKTAGTNEFQLDQNYNMPRTMNQDIVTVMSIVLDDDGPRPGGGSSSGHYGDPTP